MRPCVSRITTVVLGAAAVAAAIGCSSSSSPTGPTAKATAAHFDSLYVAAILAGTHGDTVRSRLLTFLELAAGEGATPKTITVTTASGTQQWKALSLALDDTSGSASANKVVITVAYSDDNVTTAVLSQIITGSSPSVQASLVAADTILVSQTTVTASALVTNTGPCTLQPGLLNPIFGAIGTSPCNLATFRSSLTATFPATAGVDASLTQFSYMDVSTNGSRFTAGTP